MALEKTVFTDDEVASQVQAVIRQAKQYVVLVSPYNDFWDYQESFCHRCGTRADATYTYRLCLRCFKEVGRAGGV